MAFMALICFYRFLTLLAPLIVARAAVFFCPLPIRRLELQVLGAPLTFTLPKKLKRIFKKAAELLVKTSRGFFKST
jgi:hypothetical protein